ncbi:hypothetical protein Patl1_11871 [Pistacia atlantica]|uniref:Uncharacterized protein n=1 Tax=Pistacia atlantica TaxID=434234 RepID=A0ACC1A853_9ROSI|nr:hypothetical protein Patl1_11871 [Pistacia atlantica]
MASAQVQLPHNLDAILQEADSQINKSSNNLIEQLHGGIFLNQNKLASPEVHISYRLFLKFSVDKLSGANTFEIYARGLTIAWGNDERYWNHPVEVENHPVNLKLTLPSQTPMEHKQDLSILPENKWPDIPVGVFSTNCGMTGDMEISMYEHGS